MAVFAVAVVCAGVGVVDAAQPDTAAAASGVPSYAMAIATNEFKIQNPSACGDDIRSGGSLLDGGRVYLARCYGAAQAPRVRGTVGSRALSFRTDKNFRYPNAIVKDRSKNTWKDSAGQTLRDRVEISTPWDLPFNTDVWVGFDLRIPSGVSDVTGSGAYVLQLWQCSTNPIAGLRIQAKPGGSHNVQFMRRGEAPGVNYDQEMATQSLGVNEWNSFVIKYRVVPYRAGSGKVGKIAVYHKKAGSNAVEKKLFERTEYFGYNSRSRCKDFTDKFRIRFGMYKDYQPGATFQSDFRNVRVGGSKAAVQPYNRT